MTALLRFLAGITVGVIVPLGVILGLAYFSGEDPQVVVLGDLSENERSELEDIVARTIVDSGRWVSKVEIEREIDKVPWVVETRIWRTVTNSLHVQVLDSGASTTSTTGAIPGVPSSEITKDAQQTTHPITDEKIELELRNLAKDVGDMLETVQRSSEGLKITLESGTSVLLGNRDPMERMKRFLTVYREIGRSMGPSRVVADARYDHGVAVAVIDVDVGDFYDTDQSITSAPVVITHE